MIVKLLVKSVIISYLTGNERLCMCNCGTYSMLASKLNFISDYDAEVTLKCKFE
jgi:hypothetical protein